jgi:hypothetical protein
MSYPKPSAEDIQRMQRRHDRQRERREQQRHTDAKTVMLARKAGVDLGVIPPGDRALHWAAIEAETELFLKFQRIANMAKYKAALNTQKPR